jgi:hypothetical protein
MVGESKRKYDKVADQMASALARPLVPDRRAGGVSIAGPPGNQWLPFSASLMSDEEPMHQLQNRTYAGEPGETVSVQTDVAGGGAVTVVVDGVELGEDPTFTLKANPGDETHMRIALFGANGDSCVVRIDQVDGGTDGDLLLVQSLDPAPIHLYRFIVTPATAMAALEAARLSRGVNRGAATAKSARKRTSRRKK